jgi:hypothetical protein
MADVHDDGLRRVLPDGYLPGDEKLSITAGLRYEIPGVYKERFDRIATFNRYEPNPALTGILVNGKPVLGAYDPVNTPNHPYRGQTAEHYGLLAPRIGIAYRLNNTTVIRTGRGPILHSR